MISKVNMKLVMTVLFAVGWFLNGICGTSIDLQYLLMFYGTVVTGEIGTHAINSKYNSEKGEMPSVNH